MQFTHFVKYIGKNLRMNLYSFLLEMYWSHIFTQIYISFKEMDAYSSSWSRNFGPISSRISCDDRRAITYPASYHTFAGSLIYLVADSLAYFNVDSLKEKKQSVPRSFMLQTSGR